jgi:gentisate 1,2-dioxygenase
MTTLYHRITLLVPQNPDREEEPGSWNWTDLVQATSAVIVKSSEPVPGEAAVQQLRDAGFDGEAADLAAELKSGGAE